MEDRNQEVYEKLARLQILLQRHQMQSRTERGLFTDSARGQGRVLAMLRMQPEISTKDLSFLLGIRQQSLNELIKKLEGSGLVERVPSEADRRVMIVRLTEKGRQESPTDSSRPDILSSLSQEEQELFIAFVDRILASLESALGADEIDDFEAWANAMRERVGEEAFAQMVSMRGGFGGKPDSSTGSPHDDADGQADDA